MAPQEVSRSAGASAFHDQVAGRLLAMAASKWRLLVPVYSDEGVVLRTHNLGEADRIITVLTRRHGKVRAVAKGVRRSRSKFGARLEPFSYVDLQLAVGRNLDIVTQVVTRDSFGESIVGDYSRFTSGQAILETADRLVAEEAEPALQQFLLLVGALRALASDYPDRTETQVLDSYLLRALSVAGYAPILDACARCADTAQLDYFNPASGGMVCTACRPGGSGRVSPGTAAYLAALLTGDWPAAVAAPKPQRREASGLVAAFVTWHIERGLRSLAHVER